MPKGERLRALFITTAFPPESQAGAHRLRRFAIGLPKHGIEMAVVTVHPRCVATIIDDSLCEGLPADMPVVRVPCWDPYQHMGRYRYTFPRRGRIAWLLYMSVWFWVRLFPRVAFPDPHAAWIVAALMPALTLARRFKPDVIVASMPSYSAAVLGAVVARVLHKPMVLDCRDPWSGVRPPIGKRSIMRAVHQLLEKWVWQSVTCGTAVTQDAADFIGQHVGEAVRNKLTVIPSAVDFDLASDIEPYPEPAFSLVYAGNYGYGTEGLEVLIKAIRVMVEKHHVMPGHFSLKLFGPYHLSTVKFARRHGVADYVRWYGSVGHKHLLKHLKGATASVAVEPEKYYYTLPGKALESLSVRKPVLAISPHGSALEEFLERTGMGWNFDFGEHLALSDKMALLINNPDSVPTNPDPDGIAPYLIDNIICRFANLLQLAAKKGVPSNGHAERLCQNQVF